MHNLQRLVYYSRNLVTGSQAEIGAEIEQILAASRRNNAQAGITGALMFNSGCFAQILEGPRSELEQTFERIQRDPRHTGVVVLDYARMETRSFPNWSMAFTGENAHDGAAFAAIGRDSGFDPSTITADMIFEKLHRVVREEEAAAA